MVQNADIADILDKIGSVLEIDEASPFRIRAYKNASDSIRFFDPPIAEMVGRGEDLTKLDGVGPGIAKKIEEILQTGAGAFLEKLELEVGPGLFDLLRIPGLGPKRVRTLRNELGVHSPEELSRAIDEGRLREVAGFGEKTEERLKRRIARLKDASDP